MGPKDIAGITPVQAPARFAATPGQATIHRVAKQFEAMFMTEMLHQAHNKSHAVGVFRMGEGESAMQPFMDQALGDAVASKGGAGIATSIERILSGPHASRIGK